MEFNMFTTKRTTTDSIRCFINILLITSMYPSSIQFPILPSLTCSESQFVDEIKSDGSLSHSHLLALEVLSIHLTDISDHILESSCCFVLLIVLLSLNTLFRLTIQHPHPWNRLIHKLTNKHQYVP